MHILKILCIFLQRLFVYLILYFSMIPVCVFLIALLVYVNDTYMCILNSTGYILSYIFDSACLYILMAPIWIFFDSAGEFLYMKALPLLYLHRNLKKFFRIFACLLHFTLISWVLISARMKSSFSRLHIRYRNSHFQSFDLIQTDCAY